MVALAPIGICTGALATPRGGARPPSPEGGRTLGLTIGPGPSGTPARAGVREPIFVTPPLVVGGTETGSPSRGAAAVAETDPGPALTAALMVLSSLLVSFLFSLFSSTNLPK